MLNPKFATRPDLKHGYNVNIYTVLSFVFSRI